MRKEFWSEATERFSKAKGRLPNIPVEIRVPTTHHIAHPNEIVSAVKNLRETGYLARLKHRGLHFVPTRTQGGVLLGVVGTAAAIGAGYQWYKRIKEHAIIEDGFPDEDPTTQIPLEEGLAMSVNPDIPEAPFDDTQLTE